MQVRCPVEGRNGDDGFIEVDQVKLFRNFPELQFEGRIHEQILMAIRRAGGTVAWTDLFVVHSGADQSAEGRARKLERDLRILQLEYQERPDHPFTLFNLGMTWAEAAGHAGENGDGSLLCEAPCGPLRQKTPVPVFYHEQAIGFLWQSIGRSGSDDSHLRKAYALLVSSYGKLGRHLTAWETCEQGLRRFPDDAELRFRRATLLHQFGRFAEAAETYEALLQSQDQRHLSSVDRGIKGFRARQNLAVVYTQMGQSAKAEEQWRNVLRERPSYRAAWRGLGEMLLVQGKFDEALAAADSLCRHDSLADRRDQPGGSRQDSFLSEGIILRGRALAARGDIAAARHEFEQAVAEFPNDVEPLQALCRLLFEHADPADTRQAIEELLRRDPQDAAAYHNLGSVYYRLGQYEASAGDRKGSGSRFRQQEHWIRQSRRTHWPRASMPNWSTSTAR
jgi:tetratricopeptide (TPR) repeat protein